MGAAVASALGAVVSACSLGLDESKIGGGPGDGGSSGGLEDGSVVGEDGGDGASGADAGDAGCSTSAQCVSSNPCRVGSCVGGACVYDVCPTSTACEGSTCLSTGTCSVATPYGFHATAISVTQGSVGCNGNAAVCVAAAYPFVFVGTTEGVVAFPVSDPSNSSPAAVPVLGLPFVPSFITSMGSRVYFVGSAFGSGPTWRAQIATLSVPSDPLATSMTATTAFDTMTDGTISAAWAATDGSLFVADDDASRFFPIADVKAPLKDGDTLGFFPSPGVPVGAGPVVPSGNRVVIARYSSTGSLFDTFFSLETGAATGNAQNAGEQSTLTEDGGALAMGPTAPPATFAQGSDGSVIWNTGTVVVEDAGTPEIATSRFAWLLSDGNATTFDPTPNLDVEVYPAPLAYGTTVAGPVAEINPTTALVLAAAHEEPTETSVQVVLKGTALALQTTGDAGALVRTIIPAGPASVGAAASNGFGYVLEADSTGSLELHVFSPACAQ